MLFVCADPCPSVVELTAPMNCRDIESLILAERDGVLTLEEHTALSAHVGTCPACRDLRARIGEATSFLKTDAANVPVPDVELELRMIRSRLSGEAAKSARKRPLAPVIWFGAALAAAAALLFAFLANRPEPVSPETFVVVPVPAEVPAPNASTIAYVDKDSGWLVVWAAESTPTTRS
jgi:predicted anti-sigma-YlaC factor YlaD